MNEETLEILKECQELLNALTHADAWLEVPSALPDLDKLKEKLAEKIEAAKLSDEEKAAFDELGAANVIYIPSRYSEQTEADRERLKIFKSLTYKDLINFSVDANRDYVFVSRKDTGRF